MRGCGEGESGAICEVWEEVRMYSGLMIRFFSLSLIQRGVEGTNVWRFNGTLFFLSDKGLMMTKHLSLIQWTASWLRTRNASSRVPHRSSARCGLWFPIWQRILFYCRIIPNVYFVITYSFSRSIHFIVDSSLTATHFQRR